MEAVYKAGAVCLIGALLAVILKKNSPDMGFVLVMAVAAVVLLWLQDILRDVMDFLQRMAQECGLAPEVFVPLVKTVGIAIISRLGAGLCKDAGEGTLATLVEIAAAFGAIWVSLPLLQAVWEMLQTML